MLVVKACFILWYDVSCFIQLLAENNSTKREGDQNLAKVFCLRAFDIDKLRCKS